MAWYDCPQSNVIKTYYSEPRDLTDAEIKALPTTAITLVASPGAGRAIIPRFGFLLVDSATANYATYDPTCSIEIRPAGTAGILQILYGDSGSEGTVPALLWSGGVRFVYMGLRGKVASPDLYPLSDAPENLEDEALVLFGSNGALGNFTGGDAANYGVVQVEYNIFNFTTKRFE